MSNLFSRRITIAVLAVVAGGCAYDFDYEHIELPTGFEIIEYGRTQLNNVRDHNDMPVRYKMEREAYILHAQIDVRSISPRITFSVEGKSLIDAHLRGAGVPCFLFENPVHPQEIELFGYPEGSIRFVWNPSNHGSCHGRPPPQAESRIIEISIVDGMGTVAATENVYFDIVTNGIYREFDGP